MSSPVNDDGDNRRAVNVPAWARDERRYEDKRRLHDEIVAEVQRLKPSRGSSPADTDFQTRYEDDRPGIRKPAAATEPFNPHEARRGARRSQSIDPVPAQAPPKLEPGGSTWGIVPRLVGAAALAVVVAVFVTRAGWFSSIDGSATRDNNEAIAVGSLGAAAGQANTKQSVAVLPVNYPLEQPSGLSQHADSQRRGERALAVTRSIQDQIKPEAQQNDSPAQQKPKVQQNDAKALPPSAVPEPRVLDFLKPEEIESLLKRGQDLIATGDISGGRLLLKRAAEAGDSRASLALAGTFDAAVLATLGVLGVSPDAANARAWYTRAAEQGSPEAARRLKQLASQ
jgi:hypothetical protein